MRSHHGVRQGEAVGRVNVPNGTTWEGLRRGKERYPFTVHSCLKKWGITRATECDKPEITKFMNKVFFKEEPSSMICEVSDKENVSDELLELVVDGVDDCISFMAQTELKDKSKKLAGVAINSIRPTVYEADHWESALEGIKCDKEKELLLLWQQISKLPKDPEEHFGCVDCVFELEYLSVDPMMQRQGIAKALLLESMREACRKGFRYLRMDCTSAFSARLGECSGMRRIDEVFYKELRNSEGKRYRNVQHPHIKAIVLIADLHAMSLS